MSHPLQYLHDQIDEWRAQGVYQRLRVLESASAAEARFDGKEVINLASNNYLGLTTHPNCARLRWTPSASTEWEAARCGPSAGR